MHAALAFNVAYNATLSRVTVRNSSGFGLHADRVFGSVRVHESAFLYNTGNKQYYVEMFVSGMRNVKTIIVHT